jgi:hypothetical protein
MLNQKIQAVTGTGKHGFTNSPRRREPCKKSATAGNGNQPILPAIQLGRHPFRRNFSRPARSCAVGATEAKRPQPCSPRQDAGFFLAVGANILYYSRFVSWFFPAEFSATLQTSVKE